MQFPFCLLQHIGRLRRPRWAQALLIVVALLVMARIAAPVAMRWYAERTLNRTPGYVAYIADVDLHIWRGAYRIEGLAIDRLVGADGRREPYFATASLELSVAWRQLMSGRVVGEICFKRPILNLIADKKAAQNKDDVQERAKEAEQEREKGEKPGADDLETRTGAEVDWQDRVARLFPLTINRITVHHGEIHYVDTANHLDAPLEELELVVTGLTNRPAAGQRLPCGLVATATTLGGGQLRVDARVDPLASAATFTVQASLEGVDLVELNELLRSYAGFDVEAGKLDLYVDAAVDAGRLTGHAKPLITELNVLDASKERKEDGVKQVIKEAAIGTAAEMVEAQGKDRQAARIPLEGSFDDPQTDVWSIVGSVLKNAFITSIKPGHGEEEDAKGQPDQRNERRKRAEWAPLSG